MSYQELFGLTGRLPYQMPDFAAIKPEDYGPAFEEAMAAELAGLEEIATADGPPTVEWIAQWERAGVFLRRVGGAFYTQKDSDTNDVLDATDEEFAAKLAAHADKILLDRRLYDKLVALQAAADAGDVALDAQDAWWLSESLRDYRRAGIDLTLLEQERLKDLNQQIATLEARFASLTPVVRGASAVRIDTVEELDGLSDEQVAAAKAAAESRGWDGYALELVNTTQQPMLAKLNVRETRRKLFEASVGRGQIDGADVRPMILELLPLRAEKARLLGFEHYAAYVADDGCIKTTANVMDLLLKVGRAAVANARREAAELQVQLGEIYPGATLEPWDWQWLAERQKAAQLELADEALAPYLPFESVLVNGVFAAAEGLYGITFSPREDVVGYAPDMRAYEVREADGTPLALVLFDPYARPSKQGGAWMTDMVQQNHLLEVKPVVTNNCNQPKPSAGKPSLMTWDEVTTLFHEFGHDLHGMLSDVRYPSMSGTETPTDFVEYPSQVNEIWAWEPALISQYARHYETGEPMPAEWVDRLAASRHFGEGYAAAEIYQAMLLDQAWHQADPLGLPGVDGVDAFEQAALEGYGVAFPLVPPRYRTCYFSHIWGVGYAAAYYSYLWSEVLDADTAAWFTEHGGLKRENGEAFRRQILGVGGSVDVMAAFEKFRGRPVDVTHLLQRRGLL
jgi:peptidyl-dipeptidase Dcp